MTEPMTVNVGLIVPNTGDLVDAWGSAATNPDFSAIDGLIAARAGDKARSRERRMRRLIAQAAGRMIDERIRKMNGNELEHLVEQPAIIDSQ